jgi:copper chaperone CopZ
MRLICLTLVLFAVLVAGCATTEIPKHSEIDLSASREVVLTVHGLSCPLCSNNLDGQLRRINGVEKVTIDLKTGAVAVQLGEAHSVTSKDLARAVEGAGFTLKKIDPKSAD